MLPPLDGDFFTQIQRIQSQKHLPYVDELLSYCWEQFGSGWHLTMEDFFNHIWHLEQFQKQNAITIGKTTLTPIELFMQVLLGTFEGSLLPHNASDPRVHRCKYHDAISEHLEPDDAVISFNYDVLIDCSMRFMSPYWRAKESYGITVYSGFEHWSAPQNSGDGRVHLYKLHGSVNWRELNPHITLSQAPYTRRRGKRHFYIVPPVANKQGQISGLLPIWKSAKKSLALSRSVIVIGYSLPKADAFANALFWSRSQHGGQGVRKHLDNLVVVNPDRPTRQHVIRTFRKSIGEGTRVMVFDSLSDIVPAMFGSNHRLPKSPWEYVASQLTGIEKAQCCGMTPPDGV